MHPKLRNSMKILKFLTYILLGCFINTYTSHAHELIYADSNPYNFSNNDFEERFFELNTTFIGLSSAEYTESKGNYGYLDTVKPLVISLNQGNFKDTDMDACLEIGSQVLISHVPEGLRPIMSLLDDQTVSLSFEGQAMAHERANSIKTLTIVFTEKAFNKASRLSDDALSLNTNVAINFITTTVLVDTDGDGITDDVDIDDDNDGVLDTVECTPLPINLGNADGTFEALANVASNDAFNSNVTGGSWINGVGSADSWVSPMPTTGTGVWAGIADGMPSSPQGGVFVGGWVNSTNSGESFFTNVSELNVGDKYTLSFYQANAGIADNTPVNITQKARWKVVFGSEIKFSTAMSYLGEGNQIWLLQTLEFTATATSQKLEFFVDNDGTGFDFEYMAIDHILLLEGPATSNTFTCRDTDGDGIINSLDLDSDDDGCSDGVESANTLIANNNVTTFNTGTDANSNGLLDQFENGTTGTINFTSRYNDFAIDSSLNACADTDGDGDGVGDLIDLDDDNDGILDVEELAPCIIDYNSTSSKANITASSELPPAKGTIANLLDGTEASNFFYSGNQNITDKVVAQFDFSVAVLLTKFDITLDRNSSFLAGGATYRVEGFNGTTWIDLTGTLNSDGTPDTNTISGTPFVDGFNFLSNTVKYTKYRIYGISGVSSGSPFVLEVYFTSVPETSCDTDGDGISNHLDLDSDGDACSDSVEAGNTLVSNNNITAFNTGADANTNGLLDQFEDGITGTINYTSSYSKFAVFNALNACADTDLS